MIVSALFAGGKLLQRQQERNSRPSQRSSSPSSSSSVQEANGPAAADDEFRRTLTQSICGQKMDSNPKRLSLRKALSANSGTQDDAQVDESRKALEQIRSRAQDLSDVIALADSSSKVSTTTNNNNYYYFKNAGTVKSTSTNGLQFTEQVNDPIRQIRIFTKTFSTFPVDMVKAVFYIPCAPHQFLKMLEFDRRKLWDEYFKGGDVLYHEGDPSKEDFSIKTMRFDAFPNLVRPREFEMAVHTKLDPATGTAYVKAISTLYEFGSKTSASAVRGFIPLSGFVVRPVPVNQKVCREIYNDLADRNTSNNNDKKDSASGDGGGGPQSADKQRSTATTTTQSASSSSSSSLFGQVRKMAANTVSSVAKSASASLMLRGASDSGSSSTSSASLLLPPPLFPPTTIHSEVTYVALVHPRGNIPVMLLNLVIGKQTASMKVLQGAALKSSLEDAQQQQQQQQQNRVSKL